VNAENHIIRDQNSVYHETISSDNWYIASQTVQEESERAYEREQRIPAIIAGPNSEDNLDVILWKERVAFCLNKYKRALETKQYQACEEALLSILAREPNNMEFLAKITELCTHMSTSAKSGKDYQKCEQLLMKVLAYPLDDQNRVNLSLELGGVYADMGAWRKAYHTVKKLDVDINDIPRFVQKQYIAAESLLELEDSEESCKICEQTLVSLNGKDIEKVYSHQFLYFLSTISSMRKNQLDVEFYQSNLPADFVPIRSLTVIRRLFNRGLVKKHSVFLERHKLSYNSASGELIGTDGAKNRAIAEIGESNMDLVQFLLEG